MRPLPILAPQLSPDWKRAQAPPHKNLNPMRSPFKSLVLWLAVYLLGLLSSAHCAPAPPVRYDPTPAPVTLRDATGRLWGHYNFGGAKGLFYQENGNWQRVAFPATESADMVMVAKRPNGKIVCLWSGAGFMGKDTPRLGPPAAPPATPPRDAEIGTHYDVMNTGYKLSEHYGDTSRLLGSFSAETYRLEFFVDDANVWIITDRKDIYRIGPTGAIEHVYSLAPNEEQRLDDPLDYKEEHNAFLSMVDGLGHTWFWTDMWDEGVNAYLLRGFLLWDGHKMTRHAALPGWPTKQPFVVSALAPRDATHVWMGVDEHGLYSVDCATLQARPIKEPAPKAFRYLQSITQRGDDCYLVAGARWGNDAGDAATNTGQLWRGRDGHWQRLVDGLDEDTSWGWSVDRPLLETSEGLWVAGSGSGLWLIPHAQLARAPSAAAPQGQAVAPVPIDWRRGFVLPTVTQLTQLPDGAIEAVGYGGREIITDPRALLALRPSCRIRAFQTDIGIIQDKSRHLWTVLSLPARALNEWNGVSWLSHALPKTYKINDLSELAMDKLGRVWLLPDGGSGQTAIFDPARSPAAAWQLWPNYNQALLAQRRATQGHYVALASPQFARVRSEAEVYPYVVPDYSRDGRICYRSYAKIVNLYDGKVWHKWSARQIARASKYRIVGTLDPPYFDRAGLLRVSVDGETWQWHPGRGWQKLGEANDPRPEANVPMPTSVDIPRTLTQQINNEWSERLGDKTGTVWLLWRKQLYKIRGNLYTPQFAAGENHPFLTAGSLSQVFVDGRGNRFFKIGDSPDNYVVLPHPAPVAAQVEVKPNAPDSFTLVFSSPAPAPKWFQWRLDRGRWSAPQAATTLRLDELPGGQHQVEVMAMEPVRLADRIACQSASLTSSAGRPTWPRTPPALWTRMSAGPSSRAAARSATSNTIVRNGRGEAASVSARPSAMMSAATTSAPSAAKAWAMPRPMPCAAPVIRTRRLMRRAPVR